MKNRKKNNKNKFVLAVEKMKTGIKVEYAMATCRHVKVSFGCKQNPMCTQTCMKIYINLFCKQKNQQHADIIL